MNTPDMQEVDHNRFNDFVRNTPCIEQCGAARTSYYEPGTRKLIALYEGGKHYIAQREKKVLPFKQAV